MSPHKAPSGDDPGNFVSEWFGQRIYPNIAISNKGLQVQREHRCPFLSEVTEEDRDCVKAPSSLGVCTISSRSNGPRQDWLVCPYRALNLVLLQRVSRLLFASQARPHKGARLKATRAAPLVIPAPTLQREEVRQRVLAALRQGSLCVVYIQDKLGGEISVPKTDRSPEVAFDFTMVEVKGRADSARIGRFGIFELQTMDFHGSYRAVVKNLTDALRLHKHDFHQTVKGNPSWLSEKIEGPNIANVFKRTFYQMMLKFRIGSREPSAGCVLALPRSVWDSWQRHLGGPLLSRLSSGVFVLRKPRHSGMSHRDRNWIVVFDLESASRKSPNPIRIEKVIATDPESMSHYALTVAPECAITEAGATDSLSSRIRGRISLWWPELVDSLH
jgi:hypothetical protein